MIMNIIREDHRNGYLFSTDRSRIDTACVHRFLSVQSYWAQGISIETVQRSIDHSLCVGIYFNTQQVGFARLVTDYATFAYLADVFVDEGHRGNGLSKTLMEFIQHIDELKSLRRIVLVTRDAHTLYQQFGFKALATPDKYMELHRPNVYQSIHPLK